eukprot:362732-Chlamydomonas_euryale.AAC.9
MSCVLTNVNSEEVQKSCGRCGGHTHRRGSSRKLSELHGLRAGQSSRADSARTGVLEQSTRAVGAFVRSYTAARESAQLTVQRAARESAQLTVQRCERECSADGAACCAVSKQSCCSPTGQLAKHWHKQKSRTLESAQLPGTAAGPPLKKSCQNDATPPAWRLFRAQLQHAALALD